MLHCRIVYMHWHIICFSVERGIGHAFNALVTSACMVHAEYVPAASRSSTCPQPIAIEADVTKAVQSLHMYGMFCICSLHEMALFACMQGAAEHTSGVHMFL
jgi:hypothetical protein